VRVPPTVNDLIRRPSRSSPNLALYVLGDDIDRFLSTLEPWGAAIRAAGGYLTPLVRFTFTAP
jgi:hypothetical protein